MLISDLALKDMEESSSDLLAHCRRLFDEFLHRRPSRGEQLASAQHFAIIEGQSRRIIRPVPQSPVASDAEYRWRRHPQLRDPGLDRQDQTPADQLREARATATRGIFLARSNRLDEARSAFAEAAAVRELDLATIVGYWDLPRAAMLIAALAYEDVGRVRDSAALAARIRMHLRPRAVSPIGDPRPTRRERAGASGD